ncbi:uncharacterized protein in HIS3 3'region [Kluyveromyces marxianus]|uniref:Uncharacterized protein in HIS3 3'region n=2 Tax=Kluyveromyces marxianus TaxID=4911 RepID=W0TCD4_KLUMD|nr:uncharacterized protein in HIS3 3'region [Kluyveromyces marxianus DMKU3-1042]QGN16419.1 in HIS3 3region [Kluyveromyces marxianus]BAO40693.1 uncharacterized protein in HIS3 3'region [Kluyveromyces marxianus DMKU3-1042]BAP72167.1 uncharacterized protein in HIS3 3'region [Kluyveromyces marxianus]
MSHISNLLRNSRIAQVPKTEKALFQVGNPTRPTHQVIETKPSTLQRQEWGLKASIPSKIKSRYLVFNDLDTQERLTSFEPIGQYQWNRIRFQEMGLAPRYVEEEKNPLFEGHTKKSGRLAPFSNAVHITPTTPRSEKSRKLRDINVHRAEFKQWILENHPESLAGIKNENTKSLKTLASEFLHQKLGKLDINTASKTDWNVVGTGGLTYNLRGRLRQSPNGVKQKTVVPGRILSLQGPDRAVAVGGFVAEAKSIGRNPRALQFDMGDFVRQQVLPFVIEDPKVESGTVTLAASLIEPKNDFNFAQKIGLGQRRTQFSRTSPHNAFPKKTIRSISAEESRNQSEEFLNLLKTNA